jgi:hypothetical protein
MQCRPRWSKKQMKRKEKTLENVTKIMHSSFLAQKMEANKMQHQQLLGQTCLTTSTAR